MKKIINYFLLFFLSIQLFSCLKSGSDYNNGLIQSNRSQGNSNVIEIGLTAVNTLNYHTAVFPILPYDTTVNLVPIILASADVAKEDINVTVSIYDSVLFNYNDSNGTNIYPVPPANYTVLNPNGIVTIPKGSRVGYLQIKIKPTVDYLALQYAIPFTITAIDKPGYKISGNLKNGFVQIGIKNKYDGIYTIKGYILRAGDAARTGYFKPFKRGLATVDENTNKFDNIQLWADGSGVAIGNPVLKVNSDNSVDVTSDGSLSAYNDPDYTNRYDPATRTFYISFTWGAGPLSRLCTDTLTYTGER